MRMLPDVVFLQWNGGDGLDGDGDVCWASDRILESDVRFVRADFIASGLRFLAAVLEDCTEKEEDEEIFRDRLRASSETLRKVAKDVLTGVSFGPGVETAVRSGATAEIAKDAFEHGGTVRVYILDAGGIFFEHYRRRGDNAQVCRSIDNGVWESLPEEEVFLFPEAVAENADGQVLGYEIINKTAGWFRISQFRGDTTEYVGYDEFRELYDDGIEAADQLAIGAPARAVEEKEDTVDPEVELGVLQNAFSRYSFRPRGLNRATHPPDEGYWAARVDYETCDDHNRVLRGPLGTLLFKDVRLVEMTVKPVGEADEHHENLWEPLLEVYSDDGEGVEINSERGD